MEMVIFVLGAISAILVAIIGAVLSNKNSNILQLRKLKEEHYIAYIEALHNLAAYNSDPGAVSRYTYHRDKLLIVGSEEVVKRILVYEDKAVGKVCEYHDKYLTDIVKAIRAFLESIKTPINLSFSTKLRQFSLEYGKYSREKSACLVKKSRVSVQSATYQKRSRKDLKIKDENYPNIYLKK